MGTIGRHQGKLAASGAPRGSRSFSTRAPKSTTPWNSDSVKSFPSSRSICCIVCATRHSSLTVCACAVPAPTVTGRPPVTRSSAPLTPPSVVSAVSVAGSSAWPQDAIKPGEAMVTWEPVSMITTGGNRSMMLTPVAVSRCDRMNARPRTMVADEQARGPRPLGSTAPALSRCDTRRSRSVT